MTESATYRARVKLDCPFCGERSTLDNMELPRDTPYIATTNCIVCEHSYRYVVDNTFQPSYHPHVATMRESEYQAIRAN